MTRALMVGFAVLLAAVIGGVSGGVTPALPQAGYDRPGGDYSSAAVPGGDPATCAARCERDKNCKSWSFSYPASGTQAMCFLKREVVPPVASSCCVSGVRGAGVIEPQAGATEYSIDRYGGDYRSFETPADPTGKACAEACQSEKQVPGLDLSPAGLWLGGRALFPQRDDQAAAAPAMLHFRRGALEHDPEKNRPLFSEKIRRKRKIPAAAYFTAVKNRDSRSAAGHSQTGWLFAVMSQEPTSASTRPTRSDTGKRPTPPHCKRDPAVGRIVAIVAHDEHVSLWHRDLGRIVELVRSSRA